MGIKGLSKLIKTVAPGAYKEGTISNYNGRRIAIDTSMCLYQFMVAVRVGGEQLKSESGEVTSHLNGLFFRTIRLIENGIRPIYVFDGKPPEDKSETLKKRMEAFSKNEQMLAEAKETQNTEDINKFSRRMVKVTDKHNQEAQELLKLMGVPYLIAASEAEAQCANLVKTGVAYAVATEDMDTLTFGSNILLRNLLSSASKKLPIIEFNLKKVLSDLEIPYEMFIDLCILMGCDYCPTIKGIGPNKALTLLKKHKTIEKILQENKNLKSETEVDYNKIRKLFSDPDVTDFSNEKLEWKKPDKEGLIDFLVTKRGFSVNTVENAVERQTKALGKITQTRLDQFFQPGRVVSSSKAPAVKPGGKKAGKKNKN